MSETRQPARPIWIDYRCDVEGCEGLMRPTGVMLLSQPPWYPHVCDTCDAKRDFHRKYPALEYEGV